MSDLKEQLKKLDVEKLKLANGNTLKKELRKHAAILADSIMFELDKVYDSYEPVKYVRVYGLYNSLFIDEQFHLEISSSGTSLTIGLHFDEGALHENFDGEMMNTAILLNNGWQTQGSFADIPYFGWRKPSLFVQKGIERYKKSVDKPFAVKLTIGEKEEMY